MGNQDAVNVVEQRENATDVCVNVCVDVNKRIYICKMLENNIRL